eukprot:CAMPEP_0170539976 /NCGR_PEP_ID=MMETSP0209-20121228/104352_1 /TAXON_ID=665100 ORGANISM="Litonotus pictus, Strain P1" /NCGR_SAMPLE_ID=MMETSP0209 /ASSEMBLY_ACC=CAM_ASM_000301 /LENGTH=95 /DNA_ID=CAMNT_0010842211 /DNA_START=923 /DNA_END=1206 /DNA_ORIENTATION=-
MKEESTKYFKSTLSFLLAKNDYLKTFEDNRIEIQKLLNEGKFDPENARRTTSFMVNTNVDYSEEIRSKKRSKFDDNKILNDISMRKNQEKIKKGR